VPILAILFGLILVGIGLVGYFATGRSSVTALIPAGIGLLFVLLGFAALRSGARRHAMHAAAVLALLGIGGTARGVPGAIRWIAGEDVVRWEAAVAQGATCLVCAMFLVLAIRSFVRARRAPAR
jgi:hypothetical protein